MLGEDPFGDPYRPSEARIELITYPETMTLTPILISPHWRDNEHFRVETARRIDLDGPDDLPPDLTLKVSSTLRMRRAPSRSSRRASAQIPPVVP
ncbi:hypothetical protein AB0D57_02265 [Streptomyces sp. NPDC048275]|uniref:hypothetical protein n=1 Tax=Streptomyces sp. NPDC048275 TaxID=3155629 RepID=UPI0033CAD0C5